MEIQVRMEIEGDQEAIHELNRAAFEGSNEANLVDKLREKSAFILSLVALVKNRIVGHILFTAVQLNGSIGAGLAPMAVHPDYQRIGIGSMLIKTGLDRLRDSGYSYVVVLGHPEYYPKFGFQTSAKYGIRSEFNVPAEVFMILELRKDALKDMTGIVKYRQEFSEFE